MKKIYYLVSLAIITIFTSCDYNATNFPGFDQAAKPAYVASYNYILTDADYTTIATAVKKPVNDSISLLNNQLKTAKTNKNADSTKIQASIDRLKTKLENDSTMKAATTLSTNKYFINNSQSANCISILLNNKYLYNDAGSSASVLYNQAFDTINVDSSNKLTLVTTDYNSMGITTNPIAFSGANDPNTLLPVFLKQKYPTAVKGDVKLIRYIYAATIFSKKIDTAVFIFDGTTWKKYSQVLKNFIYRTKWQEIIIILKEGFTTDIGKFTQQQVVASYAWSWGTYGGINYMKVNAGLGNINCESWLVSPLIDLNNRNNPTVSFDHAVDFISAGMVVPDLIGVYISTDYTNDVKIATWTKLDIVYPPTAITSSWTPFVNSGKVSLKSYVNKKVTIAFKYISAGTAMGWEVANLNVLDE